MTMESRRPFIGIGLGMSLVFGIACGAQPSSSGGQGAAVTTPHVPGAVQSQYFAPTRLQQQLASKAPVTAAAPSDSQRRLAASLDRYFLRAATRRFYLHLDKPLYQPGETIWFRAWELATPTLAPDRAAHGVSVELVSPKGAIVLRKRIRVIAGVASNDFVLPGHVQGGEYLVRVRSDRGGSSERKLIISTYQPPRIKKKIEFLRKAYGAGDTVSAAAVFHRATGEVLAGKTITLIAKVDGRQIVRKPVTTSDKGTLLVRFPLPSSIERGDGLLTLLINDGGVTESIQRRIPIVAAKLNVSLYPEGGHLVAGLPGRVYFSAKNLMGKPADMEGVVLDDRGAEVAHVRSFHQGLGRFELTPATGRSYTLHITKPVGIRHKVALPSIKPEGCAIQAVDDVHGDRDDVRIGVWCTTSQRVVATASLRERRLGDIATAITAGEPSVIAIPVPKGSQGAVRMTVFDGKLTPLAERLLYRGRGADLKVSIKADHASYSPRDKVSLTVETRDLAGNPVPADLSLAVADDTVLSFSDDKTAHMLARIYLESEMPGQKIEEPNFYFSNKPKAAQALDLVLGTQGFRRFDWLRVVPPPRPMAKRTSTARAVEPESPPPLQAAPPPLQAAPPPRPAPPKLGKLARKPRGGARAKKPRPVRVGANVARPANRPMDVLRRRAVGQAAGKAKRDVGFGRREVLAQQPAAMADKEWAGDKNQKDIKWGWAAVRTFPVPTYTANYDGPRTDFRETVFWAPSVKTDIHGKATISFPLSDAVTSFRVTAEGVSGGGLPGRAQMLVTSKLPVSLAVKMPLEVSAGDRVELPVSLANETDRSQKVTITSVFGPAFKVHGQIPKTMDIPAGERRPFFASLEVVGDGRKPADGKIRIGIDTARLTDEVTRVVKVVSVGFPQELSRAGVVKGRVRHEVHLASALPGSIEASLTMYPSPLATMVKGTEAIIREPYGCFEQASSANYPNVMVLGYLEQHDAAEPALVSKTMRVLDKGYKKLVGYESKHKGYEWFGGDPGHEALTAYGLLEFSDMTKVYGKVNGAMVTRTQNWLKSRRDGKGGYKRNKRALDSFGRASADVTNGYITYALSESGEKDLAKELQYQTRITTKTSDPYLMALAVNTMLNLQPATPATARAAVALARLQKPDGSFSGANHSITRSGGKALSVETTAIAAMALLKADKRHMATARRAIEWINKSRGGHGNFASTQATVLALKALSAYSRATRVTQSSGRARVWGNGKAAGTIAYDKGHKAALVFDDLAAKLTPGKNVIEIELQADSPLPYSLAIGYRTKMPSSNKQAKISVSTSLARPQVPVGESVKVSVEVRNLSSDGAPMTLARVGIPGGLTFQTWQLDELKKKGLIDFYETHAREVVLYFRSMPPNARKQVPLELIARVPGDFVAPASRAYLYYTDEYKHWAEPIRVTVTK